ncbi:MAG TPA: alpha-glucosidase [Puia sp.]|nr:alpha-glucosidase [Puia sp.]
MNIRLASFLILFTLLIASLFGYTQAGNSSKRSSGNWWKEAVIYQIYPRSFKDYDGDGIGDLKGINSKLDYIKSLGVTAVWLNPVYSSPNTDNGYDVSDYRKIMSDFGTMDDFDSLLHGLHERGIKLIMDLVVNHSSDEHAWFLQSRSSRTNPYRNYYHWWDAERGKPPYRYSLFDVDGNAWAYDSTTNAYYLHYFSRKQPDLNWENPKVRAEVFDIMKYWADKGIDGFRLDAFQFVAKDTSFPAFPKGFEKHFNLYYAMQGNIHHYLQEMYREVFAKYDVMSVAEGAGNSFKDAHDLVDSQRHELNMAYAFDGVDLAKPGGYSLLHFKDVFTRWDSAFEKNGWLSIFLSNHDQARMVSRFGNDSPAFRAHSSEMLTTFIMTMRGTPYFYNGDELGMTNIRFDSIGDYRDVQTLNAYQHELKTGGNLKKFMTFQASVSRDNGRTPFQWDSSPNAGFTTGTPWIKVNPNYKAINAESEDKDPNSVLNYFRKIVSLRRTHPALVYGKYKLLDRNNTHVYSYLRTVPGERFLVMLNFGPVPASVFPGFDLRGSTLLLSNYENSDTKRGKTNVLRPYEARVYKLRS